MDEIDIDEVKEWLEKGDIARVAAEVKISPRQASKVLRREAKNFTFMEKLYEKAIKRKATFEALNGRLKTPQFSPK